MSRPPKIPRAQEPEVIERYQAGETLQQLGLHFGCSDTSVGRILRKNGIPLRPSHRRQSLSQEQRQEAFRLFRDGASTTELAAKFGCTSKHLVKLLREDGVDTRKGPKIPLADRPQLIQAYTSGCSLNQLGERYGCSQRTVRKALVEAGVQLRGQGASADPLDPQLVQKVLTFRGDGFSQEMIARQAGCSVKVVSRVLVDHGITGRPTGRHHPSWKGGRAAAEGYVMVRMAADHPFASEMRRSNGYCLEHRLVMAEHLGRSLRGHESVHHVNGDKTDNRIENLQLRKGRHGKGAAFRCQDCGSMNVKSVKLRGGDGRG